MGTTRNAVAARWEAVDDGPLAAVAALLDRARRGSGPDAGIGGRRWVAGDRDEGRARRLLGAAGRTVLALASVLTLAAAGFGWSLQQRLDADVVTSDAVGGPAAPGAELTVLLVGLDARTDAAGNPLPPALLDALHAGPDEGQLHTDTIILLHVPADSGTPAVAVSIPRDAFVPIAGGRGTHKINSAYRRGIEDAEPALRAQGLRGAELDRRGREAGRRTLVATVEAFTGVRVDHLAEINLAGFVELTEALGGVQVCLNRPAHDSYSGVDLPAGRQTVSGAGALAFVRQRHGLDGGDLDRIARQQAFAAGLAQRLAAAGVLADPARLARLVDVVTRHVVLDRGWDLDQAVAQLRRFTGADLVFRTIPTGTPNLRTPDDGIAVQVDPAQVRSFMRTTFAGDAAVRPTPSATPDVRRTGVTAVPTAPAASSDASPETTTPTRVITADGVTCVD